MKEKRNKRRINIPFIICLLIFIAALIFGAVYIISQKNREKVYDDIKEKVAVDTATPTPVPPTQAPNDTPTPIPSPTEEPVVIPVDFEAAKEINSDIYAWIRIPDTEVDYPILQSAFDVEDSYYLNHTVEKVEGLPGSIYTHKLNSRDFHDRVTIVYGHNMRDGSMFGSLGEYRDGQYAADHDTIYIYTPEHILEYRVFACITYDDRYIPGYFDFSTDDGTQAYLDSLREVRNWASYFRDEVSVSKTDKILTLSTCNGVDDQRYLIEAVLVDEK